MQENIRNYLSVEGKKLFDDIENCRVLGASNHIKMISDMMIDIIDNDSDSIDSESKIDELIEYYLLTRGNSSCAITNALNLINSLIDHSGQDCYQSCVRSAINEYFSIADQNMQNVVSYSSRILQQYNNVLLYDYSSTVEKAVLHCGKVLNIYICESRVINGGYPYIEKLKEKGHKIHFIPEASMLTVINDIDAIFIGAETFYPDGTAFNTAGSDILALIAYVYHVPYYVLTPLLKVDMRAIEGAYKDIIFRDMRQSIVKSWPKGDYNNINFKVVELVAIPPNHIDYYVTERGVFKASELFSLVYGGL